MDLISLRLAAIRWEAEGIHSFELAPPAGGLLPPFTAGAHIDVHLAPGLVRSYSLCNSQDERHRYVIGVNNDRASRGGSRHMHEQLRVGQMLDVSPPRNNFALCEDAPRSVLVAGGIGITPLLAMVRRLTSLQRPWDIHVCARTHSAAAFLGELQKLKTQAGELGRLHLHFDDTAKGLLDLRELVSKAPPDTHFYCCGPLPMLAAFEQACAGLPAAQMHVEYFSAREAPATAGGVTVECRQSGVTVQVAEGQTILDALLEAGIDVPYSCNEGVCGTCETRVLEGVPDHRDLVLTAQEQASNTVMMVCCSGAKTPKLVLDR
jgi:vanillate O-demethylase ferredoxin subunit